MKLCKDCKHFKWSMELLCGNPKVGVNLISGAPNYQYAGAMREDFEDRVSCGTEGKWWEPKPPEPAKKPWYKILVEKILQE